MRAASSSQVTRSLDGDAPFFREREQRLGRFFRSQRQIDGLPGERPLVGATEQEQRFGEVDRPGVDQLEALDELADVAVAVGAGHLEQGLRDRQRGAHADVLSREIELLRVFADLSELSRNRPVDDELHTEMRVHSPRENLHRYLQTLDVERSDLPEAFRDKLARVLGHYGVSDLDRTPQLEEAVFRVFLAQQRTGPDVRAITAILQRWHTEPAPDTAPDLPAREVLDRLVLATQLRLPALGELARSVRFRWFDQPVVDQERAAVVANVRSELAALEADPDAADRAERMSALAAVSEPIVRFLAERLENGIPADEPLLEALIRRHYREYQLDGLESRDDGRPFAVADYVVDGRPTHLVSTVATWSELTADSSFAEAVARQIRARRPEQAAVVDLYLHWPGAPKNLAMAPGHDGRRVLPHYDGIVAFSQTDFTEDLKKITVPVAGDAQRRRSDRALRGRRP